MTTEWLGDHDMAKSAPLARGFSQRVNHQVDSWNVMVASFKRRLWEGLGAALVILCFLVAVALLTYNPADPSLNTAGDATPTNFLGRDGALVADFLVQGLGLAAFLIPLILLGWAFRLLLQRPLRRMLRRLAMVVPALLLGAYAVSIVPFRPIPLPAGSGGAIGWGLQHVAQAFGLAGLEPALVIGAAVLAALLLLSIMGLSWGDWRDVGSGAGRNAARLAVCRASARLRRSASARASSRAGAPRAARVSPSPIRRSDRRARCPGCARQADRPVSQLVDAANRASPARWCTRHASPRCAPSPSCPSRRRRATGSPAWCCPARAR